jgi:hypothetical protein
MAEHKTTFLDKWDVTVEDLDAVVTGNPSLRGTILGYMSEHKLRQLLSKDSRISGIRKEDDHDRRKKGDLWVTFQGVEISLEVKSLQTNSVRQTAAGFTGNFQCDASDRRELIFDDLAESLNTTCSE